MRPGGVFHCLAGYAANFRCVAFYSTNPIALLFADGNFMERIGILRKGYDADGGAKKLFNTFAGLLGFGNTQQSHLAHEFPGIDHAQAILYSVEII